MAGMTRREVLELIERTRREGWTELDLSWEKASELPDEIGQLVNLQSLNLSGDQLATLPECVGQLINLQSLNLSSNVYPTLSPVKIAHQLSWG